MMAVKIAPLKADRPRHIYVLIVTALNLLWSVAASGAQQSTRQTPARPDFSRIEVTSLRVQENVYMLQGAGGNVTVQIGEQGVLVVDTQFAEMADKLLAEIRKLAGDKPIRYIINTHVHADHVGGNERMRQAGAAVSGGTTRPDGAGGEKGAVIIAHENVQFAMVKARGTQQAVPDGGWPTETYTGDQYDLFFNDEAVQLLYQPAAHTDGDTMVFFRKSDVLSTGDVFVTTRYPYIDRANGGSINGSINALNRILDITVPRDKQEGGTMVIPGHGRVCDEADVVEYRDMVTIIRDRIDAMVKQGMTLEQVKAARPTRDYDGRYGATSGLWTTDMFVEAVYASLRDDAGVPQ